MANSFEQYLKLKARADYTGPGDAAEKAAAQARVDRIEAEYPHWKASYQQLRDRDDFKARANIPPIDGFVGSALDWAIDSLLQTFRHAADVGRDAVRQKIDQTIHQTMGTHPTSARSGMGKKKKIDVATCDIEELIEYIRENDGIDIDADDDFPDSNRAEIEITLTLTGAEWARIVSDPAAFFTPLISALDEDLTTGDDEEDDEDDEDDEGEGE